MKNPKPRTQQGIQPAEQNRVVPIAVGWTELPLFQVGDLVVEVGRPGVLLRLESIDEDGEFCRCRDVTWGGQELCLLKELRQAAIAK